MAFNPTDDVVNLDLYKAQTERAQSLAQAAYYNALAGGQTADRALAAAQFAWKQKMDESTQTGMWNGQWNNPQEQWFTGQFGEWYGPGGAPQAGAQTLAAQQQKDTSAQDWSTLFGQYYAPGTAPEQGAQTLAGQNQQFNQGISAAGLTGLYNGQQTMQGQQQAFAQELQRQQEARAAQAQGQSQTMAYLNLLSNLRGPADWAKYQQVLGSTPGGMRDLAAAAMGQYVPGGGATTGVQPQAVSLQSVMGDVSGNPYYGQGGGQLGQPNVYGGYQPQGGQPQQTWGTGINYGGNDPNGQAGAAMGGAGAAPGSQNNPMGQLPAPNQISAQSWANFTPSQKQLMLGQYEAGGWNKDDVTALMSQALPKYANNSATAGTWRMA